jgi:hypothetical protein
MLYVASQRLNGNDDVGAARHLTGHLEEVGDLTLRPLA